MRRRPQTGSTRAMDDVAAGLKTRLDAGALPDGYRPSLVGARSSYFDGHFAVIDVA